MVGLTLSWFGLFHLFCYLYNPDKTPLSKEKLEYRLSPIPAPVGRAVAGGHLGVLVWVVV